MLIGICGSICSGKGTVARYLVEHHGFRHVSVDPNGSKTPRGQINSQEAESNVSNTHQKRPSATAEIFHTSDELLEYVTQRWQERWVTTDVMSKKVLDAYSRRPSFLLISVDAPILVRWQRYQRRKQEMASAAGAEQPIEPITKSLPDSQQIHPAETLEDFVMLSDAQLYHPERGQATHISGATVRLLNTSGSLANLYVNLGKLDLLSTERLRPGWDNYFMTLASLAARRSNCMKRRVGCVVVSHNRRVISTGYNGTPRGIRNCGDGGCPRCNQGLGSGHGLTTCLCIHAEENALLEAGRDRLREGAVLYCDTCPCLTCSIKIAQVGISEVVYAYGYSMDTETAAVFREAGVKLRQFVPPADGLVHLEKMEFLA
ncbi:deoxycytidylate deaminase [Diaporthe helianthi]|uniref:Deoxycytidylate deaminase n=1 Tax=Diaporthe helianthi TaxID=158607 RepID=A0A2P5HVX5_DIAHE|nr:deoxycytidylate deaminase [Diaporthe helianthi]